MAVTTSAVDATLEPLHGDDSGQSGHLVRGRVLSCYMVLDSEDEQLARSTGLDLSTASGA
jgi:hypothetical protein